MGQVNFSVRGAVRYLLQKGYGYLLRVGDSLVFVEYKTISKDRKEAKGYCCHTGKRIKIKMY